MVEGKAFLANAKHQDRISQCGEQNCSANNKKIEVIMSIHVRLIPWMDINYKENGEKQSFSSNPKHQDHVS